MTGRLDRYGEPIEDNDQGVVNQHDQGVVNQQVFTAPGLPELIFPTRRPAPRDEIHRERCAQLRAIIRAAKARREVDQ